MKLASHKILVCLPTFNEIEAIGIMIDQIIAKGFDLIVTDGGSNDGTIDVVKAKNITLLSRNGLGKGAGIIQALNYAKAQGYTHLVFLDCDLTYPVAFIPELLKYIDSHDMVSGERPMHQIVQPNRFANIVFTTLFNILYSSRLRDTQTGMRVLAIDQFQGRLVATDFTIESQIVALALRNKLPIKEVTIDYQERIGKSKVTIWDGVKIILRILSDRFF